MRNIYFCIILFAISVSAQSNLITNSVFSPYEWATYYAVKKTSPINIDGDLSDWKNVKGFTMDQRKYFFVGQGMSSAKWNGLLDLSGNFKITWDSAFIYIAAEVIDDKVTEPHGSLVEGQQSGSWDDDGIEIMFDNDGCGATRYYIGDKLHHEFHFVYSDDVPYIFDNFWVPKPGAQQPMFVLPNGELEPLAYPNEVMEKNDVTERFDQSPYNGEYKFKRTKRGYNLEVKMSLPGTQMVAINEGGHKIGFDIAFNDNDEGKGALKQQFHWSGMNGMFWRNCQFFGSLILLNE